MPDIPYEVVLPCMHSGLAGNQPLFSPRPLPFAPSRTSERKPANRTSGRRRQLSPLPPRLLPLHTSLRNCVLSALWQIFAVVHTRLYFVEKYQEMAPARQESLAKPNPHGAH